MIKSIRFQTTAKSADGGMKLLRVNLRVGKSPSKCHAGTSTNRGIQAETLPGIRKMGMQRFLHTLWYYDIVIIIIISNNNKQNEQTTIKKQMRRVYGRHE